VAAGAGVRDEGAPGVIPQTSAERDHLSTSIYEAEKFWRIRLKAWLEVTAALVITDSTGVILNTTQRFTALLGYEEGELNGQPLTTIIPSRLVPVHQAAFQRYFDSGVKRIKWDGVELPALRKDGSEVVCFVRFREERQNGDRFLAGILEPVQEAPAGGA
jgi:PAS domain S-box-containing protein